MNVFRGLKHFWEDPAYKVCKWLLHFVEPEQIPDKLFLKYQYHYVFGEKLNLKHPKKFNEKLQWLKLYDRNPLYTTLVDKSAVKGWVADKIGEEFVIPTLAVYDNVNQIDLDELPDQFVLKCTHDSGSVFICKDKRSFNLEEAKRVLDIKLKTDFYIKYREWPYKNVIPRVIAEEYKEDSSGELRDYKVYAFNGKCDYLMFCFDRSKGETKFFYFDKKWNLRKNLSCDGLKYGDSIQIPKPQNLDLIFQTAEFLSVGIPFVRIDFYEVEGNLYFGEFTFFPTGGIDDTRTEELNVYLNKHLEIKRIR
ncbi:MAG: glycosyl transferase [Lachnospiraceae bacterium]|nr:glycosyl transferase [Lachnospiraceae bacterium]